jgi:3D (Asp-Asp-Asp) domain-containing protein
MTKQNKQDLNALMALLLTVAFIGGLTTLSIFQTKTTQANELPEYLKTAWTASDSQLQQTHDQYKASQKPKIDPCALESVVCAGEQVFDPDYPTTAEISAYTSYPNQTDSSPCISADNSNICELYAQGELICASNDFEFGDKVFIEGYGTCTVHDRMNRRYTGTGNIDIYFGYDTQQALNWGRQTIPFDWEAQHSQYNK